MTRKDNVFKTLVVDDSPLMRQFVARTLSIIDGSVHVLHAANGREAMDVTQSIRPDLIITDLNMPESNGDDLLDSLAASKSLCQIPVIVLTAEGERCRGGKPFRHEGVIACLQKPVRPEELREHIAPLLRRRADDHHAARLSQ